ncbi:MAG: hypothetical protein M3Q07_10590, partial [Pseudobdellovibrionaceae bacterium]|nr:hypothetical protein [Pseudobdellovibrionaceae bacterium]
RMRILAAQGFLHSSLAPVDDWIVIGQVYPSVPRASAAVTGTVVLEEPLGDSQEETAEKLSTYIPWAELLKRTFGIDLTACPCCGARVRVIAAIIRKDAIQEILDHLNLPTGPPKRENFYKTEYVYDNFA